MVWLTICIERHRELLELHSEKSGRCRGVAIHHEAEVPVGAGPTPEHSRKPLMAPNFTYFVPHRRQRVRVAVHRRDGAQRIVGAGACADPLVGLCIAG